MRRLIKLNADKVAIVGQIAKWKGQDIFIQAAKCLHQKYPELKFLIIGDVLFNKEEELNFKQTIIEEASGCAAIQFLGHQGNVRPLLNDIDILVHASVRPEPFGRVIIEGMAAKVPVIASGIGGPLEIIEHGLSGLLYQPGNVGGLVEAIEYLLTDKQGYQKIANQAYQRFQNKFTIEQTVSLVEKHIRLSVLKD